MPSLATIRDQAGGYERKAWRLTSPLPNPNHFCVFLDAEFYLDRIDVAPLLVQLQEDGTIPPVNCLFISHQDATARQHDFLCRDDYAQFVLQNAIGPEPNKVICGLSLSALAACHIALSHPQVFLSALCQSPSCWWNDEWLTKHIPKGPATANRIWISVGDQETEAGVSHPPTGLRQEISQLDSVQRCAEALNQHGHLVNLHVFAGGHALEPWMAELPLAFRWLTHFASDTSIES
ncbi:MAG: hypothetical protein BGO01_04885 [Armatimonadetes bacterium 55-13]|nr:hypothetical protein [Armatimonadota bacterium]OJU61424.1 MAG: hypothetical protein BGO01_04885 [Armatimonadetes bacterium 55-13]